MKFKRHIKLEHGLRQIDIAPLIDVIFLMLIFFMLTTSFTFSTGIQVKLPKTITSDTLKAENFIISITAEDVIYLNNSIVTLKELKQKLGRLSKEQFILIKADRRSSVGRIVEVWDLCRSMGIEKINIATNQEK